MAEKINPSAYKQFLTMVRQAKQSGSSELRLPIKFADEMILELNEKFFENICLINDQVVDLATKLQNQSITLSNEPTVISGGTFK